MLLDHRRASLVALGVSLSVLAGASSMGPPGHGVDTGRDEWRPVSPYQAPLPMVDAQRLANIPDPDWQPGHRGIDLASIADASVTSPADGVVTFAGWVVDRPVVTIRHDDGALSSVEPVHADVEVNQRVARGQHIGRVAEGHRHCAPHSCLHWGVRVAGRYIDPLDVLEGFGPIVLWSEPTSPRDHQNAPVRSSDSRSLRTAPEWI